MADLLFDFNINKTAQIFEEDEALKKVLMDYGLYISDISIDEQNPERISMYKNIASVLLADHDFISEREIDDLFQLRFLVDRLNQIFNKVDIVDEILYRQIIFSYKYSTIKNFFRDNFTKFLPSLDASVIEDSEKMSLFQAAFMQEYDRFADIIDNIYNITDIDKVGNDYIAYLVQILGYERADDKLLGKDSFRELAKNIIEVYKMKGTNYSFELFFNFLGFDVELNEFYFDRRFYDDGIGINPYTGSDNPEDFSFYLTPHKPTEYIPENMNNPHQIGDNELTDIRSHLWWMKKLENGHSVDKLLGLNSSDPPEEGFDYTYFKTNIIQYSVRRIRSKETDSDELSKEDEAIIQAYADFLTPIFIAKQILISIQPFEDSAENLILTDASIYNFNLATWEGMFKSKSDWFIVDDWVEDPTADFGGRFALNYTEETDIATNGIDSEEPREYFLLINTYDHTAPDEFMTKDNMTNTYDEESSDEWEPPRLLKLIGTRNSTNTDFYNGSPDTGEMISLYDLTYTDERVILELYWNVLPVDDPDPYMQGLGKIVNFQESIFNRVHRLEQLNVLNRDFADWDNFSESRHIPTFEDSIEQDMTLKQFYDEPSTVNNTSLYFSTDDDATHVPWWFYDEIMMAITFYSFIGFGFVHASVTITGTVDIEREVFGTISSIGSSISPSETTIKFKPIHLGYIEVDGSVITDMIIDNGNDTAVATTNGEATEFAQDFMFISSNDYAQATVSYPTDTLGTVT